MFQQLSGMCRSGVFTKCPPTPADVVTHCYCPIGWCFVYFMTMARIVTCMADYRKQSTENTQSGLTQSSPHVHSVVNLQQPSQAVLGLYSVAIIKCWACVIQPTCRPSESPVCTAWTVAAHNLSVIGDRTSCYCATRCFSKERSIMFRKPQIRRTMYRPYSHSVRFTRSMSLKLSTTPMR